MPDIKTPGLGKDPFHAGEYGNQVVIRKKITVNDAVAIGDRMLAIEIPQGFDVQDFKEVHTASGTALTTMSFGLAYKDGTAGLSATHFCAAKTTAAAGINRMDQASFAVQTGKEAYLIGTHGGANLPAASGWEVEVELIGVYLGE